MRNELNIILKKLRDWIRDLRDELGIFERPYFKNYRKIVLHVNSIEEAKELLDDFMEKEGMEINHIAQYLYENQFISGRYMYKDYDLSQHVENEAFADRQIHVRFFEQDENGFYGYEAHDEFAPLKHSFKHYLGIGVDAELGYKWIEPRLKNYLKISEKGYVVS